MNKKRTTALLALSLAFPFTAVAQQAETQILAGSPGRYEISDGEFVTRVFFFENLGVGRKLNFEKFKALVEPCGGAIAFGSGKNKEGKAVPFLQVTCKPGMMDSVVEAIRKLSELEDFKFYLYSDKNELIYRPKSRSASDLAELVKADMSVGYAYVIIDDATNVITLYDDDFLISFLLGKLELWDRPQKMVLLDIVVAESQVDSGRDAGIFPDALRRWLPNRGDAALEFARLPVEGMKMTGAGVSLTGFSPQVLYNLLNLLERTGKGRVVTSTTLTVPNSETRSYSYGSQFPYMVLLKSGDVSEFQPLSVFQGLKLTASALVGTENLRLDMQTSCTSVIGLNEGMPILSSSNAEPSLNLPVCDSGFFRLPTMMRKERVTSRSGLPLLSRAPLIRYLCSWEQTRETEFELHIFCRARVQE